jgi:hypothetical protein
MEKKAEVMAAFKEEETDLDVIVPAVDKGQVDIARVQAALPNQVDSVLDDQSPPRACTDFLCFIVFFVLLLLGVSFFSFF